MLVIVLSFFNEQDLRDNFIWGEGEVNDSLHLDDVTFRCSCVNSRVLDVLEVLPAIGVDHVDELREDGSELADPLLDHGFLLVDFFFVKRLRALWVLVENMLRSLFRVCVVLGIHFGVWICF